ncbi:MAG: DUF4919 domain-containing protein [Bacteroidia bacterium]|nr:DUF4919 domain-containing protein [Bacteroidia bacterium]
MKNLTALFLFFTLYAAAFAQKPFDYASDYRSIKEQVLTIGGPLEYDSLLARFQRADTTMPSSDVLALMIGFTAQPAYKPYIVLDDELRINKLNMADDYKKALAVSDSFLRSYPLSIKVIFERMVAFNGLGQADSANYYANQVRLLRDAMYDSGSIFDKEGAAFALAPLDGRYFLLALGYEALTVAYVTDSMRYRIEMIEIKNNNGTKVPFYFNIQHAHLTNTQK